MEKIITESKQGTSLALTPKLKTQKSYSLKAMVVK
jgi:hypothetical protein